jgi:DNA-binding beta-propeller fold protein YncE
MFRFGKINIFHPQLSTGVSPGRAYLLAMSAAVVAALLALVVLIGFGSDRAQADPRPDLYLLPPEALYPEGIAAENKSGTFYVSSVADGSIYRGNVGNEQAELFLPGGEDGRTQAAGLALEDGLLYVAGGQTGKVFVYDTSSGDLVRSFAAQGTGFFLNDVTVNPHSGDAYITDSFVPVLWRVPAEEVTGSPQTGELEPWLDLTGTPIAYTAGFNLNGIVATPNGRYLLTVQSNSGNLYRIDTQTKQVTQVDLGGATLTGGDGLVLRGHTLYVVRNQEFITVVSLAGQFTSGGVKGSSSEPSLDFSTTGALVRGRLLVVNSQFDEGGPVGGTDPEIPFTVSSMRAP